MLVLPRNQDTLLAIRHQLENSALEQLEAALEKLTNQQEDPAHPSTKHMQNVLQKFKLELLEALPKKRNLKYDNRTLFLFLSHVIARDSELSLNFWSEVHRIQRRFSIHSEHLLLFNLGLYYSRTNQHDSAIFQYTKCLKVCPHFWPGVLNCSLLLHRLGRDEEARIVAHNYLKYYPQSNPKLEQHFLIVADAQDYNYIIKKYSNKSISIQCLYNLARYLHKIGKLQQAHHVYSDIEQISGASGRMRLCCRINRARIMQQQGYLAEAISIYRSTWPDHPEIKAKLTKLRKRKISSGQIHQTATNGFDVLNSTQLNTTQQLMSPRFPDYYTSPMAKPNSSQQKYQNISLNSISNIQNSGNSSEAYRIQKLKFLLQKEKEIKNFFQNTYFNVSRLKQQVKASHQESVKNQLLMHLENYQGNEALRSKLEEEFRATKDNMLKQQKQKQLHDTAKEYITQNFGAPFMKKKPVICVQTPNILKKSWSPYNRAMILKTQRDSQNKPFRGDALSRSSNKLSNHSNSKMYFFGSPNSRDSERSFQTKNKSNNGKEGSEGAISCENSRLLIQENSKPRSSHMSEDMNHIAVSKRKLESLEGVQKQSIQISSRKNLEEIASLAKTGRKSEEGLSNKGSNRLLELQADRNQDLPAKDSIQESQPIEEKATQECQETERQLKQAEEEQQQAVTLTETGLLGVSPVEIQMTPQEAEDTEREKVQPNIQQKNSELQTNQKYGITDQKIAQSKKEIAEPVSQSKEPQKISINQPTQNVPKKQAKTSRGKETVVKFVQDKSPSKGALKSETKTLIKSSSKIKPAITQKTILKQDSNIKPKIQIKTTPLNNSSNNTVKNDVPKTQRAEASKEKQLQSSKVIKLESPTKEPPKQVLKNNIRINKDKNSKSSKNIPKAPSAQPQIVVVKSGASEDNVSIKEQEDLDTLLRPSRKNLSDSEQGGQMNKTEQQLEVYKLKYKQASTSEEKSEVLINIASVFEVLGQLDNAEKTLKKAIKFGQPTAFYKFGDLLLTCGKVEEGIQNLQKAVCMLQDNEQVKLKLAYGYSMIQRGLSNAQSITNQILLRDPTNIKAIILSSNIHQKMGNIDIALRIVEAIDSTSTNQSIKHYMGLLHLQKEDVEGAYRYFKEALSINKHYVPSLIESATILSTDHREHAIKLFKKVLDLEPKNLVALTRLAKIFETDKENNFLAIQTYQKVLSICESYESLMNLGSCFMTQKKYQKAIDNFKKAITLNSTADAWKKIAECYELLKNYEKALNFYTLAIHLEPSAKIYNKIGMCQIYLQNFKEAISSFKQSLELEENADSYNLIAHCHYLLEQYDDAISNYTAALDLKGPSPGTLYNMAICYDQKEEYLSSKLIYERILTIEPNNTKCLYNLANILLIMGKNSQALLLFEKALALEPGNYSRRLELVDLYETLGDLHKAEMGLLLCYKQNDQDTEILEKLIKLYKKKKDIKKVNKFQKILLTIKAKMFRMKTQE